MFCLWGAGEKCLRRPQPLPNNALTNGTARGTAAAAAADAMADYVPFLADNIVAYNVMPFLPLFFVIAQSWLIIEICSISAHEKKTHEFCMYR